MRHVHGEEVPIAVDLQPKKTTQKATYIGAKDKDRNRPAMTLAGRESAEEHPTTADLVSKTEKPKMKRPKEEERP
jgi:hypothetical protein